jgi:hypothetical protein
MRRLAVTLATAVVAACGLLLLTGPTGPAGAAATATLRLDGIGPLTLGMTRTAAVRTGWLSNRGTGCELAGPQPPITYKLNGKGAPSSVEGTAEFSGGKLTVLTFSKGVRTAVGVVVGTTTTTQMVARYKAAGLKAKATRSDVFDATFVAVTKKGSQVLGGLATGKSKLVTELAIPAVPVCD